MLKIEGENCHEQKTIANYFNKFFTTVAANLVQKLPLGKNLYGSNSANLKDFYSKNKSGRETFHFKHVSEEFVLKELKTTKSL